MNIPIIKFSIFFLLANISLYILSAQQTKSQDAILITEIGRYPAVYIDDKNVVHITYSQDNNIYYVFSDNGGTGYSQPVLVDKTSYWKYSSPHITTTQDYIVLAAVSNKNIFSWRKKRGEPGIVEWEKAVKVNDVDGVATEGLVSIAGGKNNLIYAVWVDERMKGNFKVYGSYSIDGSMTWAKNKLIYQSPDGSICPCCRPNIAIHKDSVHILFRNDVRGARNMFLLSSDDEGETFDHPKKLGTGSWQLNACPVDGGGLTLDKKGKVYTTWRRNNEIFLSEPDKAEQKISLGRSSKITFSSKGIYMAWQYEGDIIVRLPNAKTVNLGKGWSPSVTSSLNLPYCICVWEGQDNKIMAKKLIIAK